MAIPISIKPQSLHSPLLSPHLLSQVQHKLYALPLRYRKSISVHSSLSSSPNRIASSYSGWDDLTLSESDNANPIRNLFSSLGITGGKNGVLFFFGFISALVISRVRVSPFAMLPVSVLVFAAGFAAGSKGGEIRVTGEKSWGGYEKFSVLKSIIGELEVKMSELRNGLVAIDELGHLERVKIRNSIDIVDYVKNKLGNVANDMDKDFNFGEIIEGKKKLKPKMIRKGTYLENAASDIVKYFGDLIKENIFELNSPSTKNANKKEISVEINVKKDENLVSGNIMNEGSNAISPKYSNYSKFVELKEDILGNSETAFNDINSSLYFTSKQGCIEEMVLKDKNSKFGKINLFRDSVEESSLLEQTLEIRDRSYKFKSEQIQENTFNKEGTKIKNKIDASSIEKEFNKNLKKASKILIEAREFMKNNKYDEEKIDALLYQSGNILSTNIDLKPNSILAIGQLGNTYLLHGELKLKISRELRSLLSNKEKLNLSSKIFEKKMLSIEGIASVLVEVCEECESLLAGAGRNYKKVLAIDGNDVKALYNWGLALSLRAQLISDIGPEGAIEADKVYLAAIDKFDAILSKNNSYAPEALYRWGIALQNRSHLRVRHDKEKVKLLLQAKSLFEEVLYLDADNPNVKHALSSCISELEYDSRLL